MKKQKLKNLLKLGILTFGISLLLTNCNKNDDIPPQEIQQERTITEISFEDFKSNTNLNNQFQSLNKTFNEVKLSSKNNLNQKSSSDFEDATILTDNIIKIKKDGFTTYTFTILTQTENDEFYNLVLYVNDNQEIYKSHILQYTPSQKWLADTSKHFSGNVKIIHNDAFNVGNLLQAKSSLSAKSNLLDDCIDSVTISYECSNGREGHQESPRSSGCYAQDFYVYITINSYPCSGGSGDDGGGFDPYDGGGTSTSGGGGGSDDDSGIVTAPNTVPYTSQLKNFQSGTLNPIERTYYNRDSNIKNTIDRYLIDRNFSSISKLDAKSALEFSSNLNLNFQQFNWVFNNRNSLDLMDIKEDLIESSLESNTIAVMKIDANRAKTGWDFSRTGTFPNRPSLTYKATFKPNQGETMYLLNNGLVLYQSSTKRVVNKALPNTIASSEVITDGYNYIFNYSSNTWYEYRMPPATPNAKADIDFLLDAFWNGVKIVGRYATPLEDAIILIDGNDFDGIAQNKVQTAGFMIVGLIPGGKALKPVTKIVNGVIKYQKIVKVTVNGVSKNITLPINIVNGIVEFGSDGYNRTQLRKILNITDSAIQGHHIVPLNLKDLDIVQKAAKSDNVFHISDKLNGIPLPSTNHLTGHNSIGGYSDTVRDILINFSENNQNIDYNSAYNFLNGLTNHIRGVIEANPNMNMGQISNLISYP